MGPIPYRDPFEEAASWDDAPSSKAGQNGQRPASGAFDIAGFMARASKMLGLEIRGPQSTVAGTEWRFVGGCPFQPGYSGANAAVIEKPSGELGFNCFCGDHTKKQWRELRELVDGLPKEKARPETAPRTTTPSVLTVSDLMKLETPVELMVFEGMPIPARGASLTVGAAKSGKTLLVVQEAIAVATGTPLFGCYRVQTPGAVLILEQDDPSGAISIKTILELAGVKRETPLYVVPRVPFGFGPALLTWLEGQIAALHLKMVVLDSYTSLRGPRVAGIDIVKAEQNDLLLIDSLAKRTGCAIQIVHHVSKSSAALDWSEKAAGTFAMSAATEAQIHVSRFPELEGAAPERLIRIRGRHAADVELVLRFRKETLDYEHVLEGGAAPFYPVLLQLRTEFGHESFGAKELCHRTGVSRATAHRQIDRLYRADALIKRGYGEYAVRP